MSNNIESSLSKLDLIYRNIPSVPCKACGKCCVSPTITFLEFLYLMDGVYRFEKEQIQHFFSIPVKFHEKHEGNLQCRFIDKHGHCTVHKFRSMACRLHGLPAINMLGIEEIENCKIMPPSSLPEVKVNTLKKWLENLSQLNSEIFNHYKEPFWLAGLNIECWLAILYDPYFNLAPFKHFREIFKKRYPKLSEMKYSDETNLKEKVDKITMFFEFIKTGVSEELIDLLSSIINDYPVTGTYYLNEAKKYKEIIESRLR